MALLKLYQVTTPTTATQVTTTHTPVRRVIVSASAGGAYSVGDSTMTAGTTGVVVPAAASPLTIGHASSNTAFDLAELYVIAAAGNVNILATLL